jgi:GNAT superfamily N-acetyltransferase
MTHTTIRQVYGDEKTEILYQLASYAFNPSPPLPDRAEREEVFRERENETYFALLEDERAVASIVSAPMTQQVRGALFKAGAIWGVATHPAARRKGYSRRLMACLLQALREQDRPLSLLYPFRESFYQRLGYVTFPLPRIAKFEAAALLPLLSQKLPGRVERTYIGEEYDTFRRFLSSLQETIHGMALFDEPGRTLPHRNRFWLALAYVEDEPVGAMMYQLQGEHVTQFTLNAGFFYHRTIEGRYLLLEWIARHVDQVTQVELWLPCYELPETWLADLQVRVESAPRAPMGRVVDVTKIGGMAAGPGHFSARMTDPLCPWNEGTWQFEGVNGALQVSPASHADCHLTVQGLTALVYGVRDPGDYAFHGWGDPPPQLQNVMRAMFPPLMPHVHEYF